MNQTPKISVGYRGISLFLPDTNYDIKSLLQELLNMEQRLHDKIDLGLSLTNKNMHSLYKEQRKQIEKLKESLLSPKEVG